MQFHKYPVFSFARPQMKAPTTPTVTVDGEYPRDSLGFGELNPSPS
jgi:hypothetical protein